MMNDEKGKMAESSEIYTMNKDGKFAGHKLAWFHSSGLSNTCLIIQSIKKLQTRLNIKQREKRPTGQIPDY